MALFELENLTYLYPPNFYPGLDGVDFSLVEGEFVLLLGSSGSGKSTLLRLLGGLIPDFYGGKVEGKAGYRGKKLRDWQRADLAREIGMVFQDPEKQLILRGVEREIAFGLENLGVPSVEMKRRIAEVMAFFGLHELKQRPSTLDLSGGEKQKLVLASILAMQPRVLLLDEPTSQLDPVAADEILNLIKKLNEDLGITVVLVEQRLERCLHLADRIIFMEKGRIQAEGTPAEMVPWLSERQSAFVPPVAKLFAQIGIKPIPLTIKQGRKVLRQLCQAEVEERKTRGDLSLKKNTENSAKIGCEPGLKRFINKTWEAEKVIELKKVWFSYPPGLEVLREVSLEIKAGEWVAVMGANGTGKSTLLRQLTALLQPDRGRVLVKGQDLKHLGPADAAQWVGYLAQNPQHYLLNDTVEEELRFTLDNLGIKETGQIEEILGVLDLTRYRTANPRDLSTGEKQRVALASVLVSRPSILVLDEPTRGMDWLLKHQLGRLLTQLRGEGIAILLVTHDLEFVAEYADRVILMDQGSIVADGNKHQVLSSGLFYAPQLNKLFQGLNNQVVTYADAVLQMEVRGYVF